MCVFNLKVQSQGGDIYDEKSMSRTRHDSAKGQVVTWYKPVNKQFNLAPGSAMNSTHQYVCVQYCPQQGEFTPYIQIGDGHTGILHRVTDNGAETVSQAGPGAQTKTAEHYSWDQSILGVVHLGHIDFYVDQSVNPMSPFLQKSKIDPLGQDKGSSNSSYYQVTKKEFRNS